MASASYASILGTLGFLLCLLVLGMLLYKLGWYTTTASVDFPPQRGESGTT